MNISAKMQPERIHRSGALRFFHVPFAAAITERIAAQKAFAVL